MFAIKAEWCYTWISPTREITPELQDLKTDMVYTVKNLKANLESCINFLQCLALYLSKYFNSKFIILVDEFDSPIRDAPSEVEEEITKRIGKLLSPLVKV
jgi:hypothetical protein